jgi:SAM-dependent methyltransferase
MKTFLRKHTPKPIWDALASGKSSVKDAADLMRGLPPRSMRAFVGPSDFRRYGYEFLAYFKEHGGLKPDHRVLEVGCGIGRMAIPLTKYLSESGSYDGFDVIPHAITWCSDKITPRYPNFRFQLADIWNRVHNPNGRLKAADFRFPYDDGAFDFIFLSSVFEHMLPRDVNHYFSEISRVLRPGGRCLITWFLLNNESKHLIERGKSRKQFAYPIGSCLTIDPKVPEAAIAYEESDVLELYTQHGITISHPIYYGSWCGRTEHLSRHDICIGHKSGPTITHSLRQKRRAAQ